MKLRIIALVVSMSALTACATPQRLPQPVGKARPVNSLATAEMLKHEAGYVVVGPERNNRDTKRKLLRTKPQSAFARLPGETELIERTVIVPFKFASDEFSPSNYQRYRITQLLAVADRVEVRGRTDGKGNSKTNERMAFKRAEAAKRYLIDRGVPNNIIAINYRAAGDHIADNERSAGRDMNRRVEIEFYIDDFTTDRAAGIALLESDPL